MEKLSWDKKFEIGIEKIDFQHRKLFDLTVDLTDAIESGRGRQIIIDVLKSLIEYTKTHFVDEEKLMKDVAYPDREIHFREHEDFINEIYSDTAEFLQGKKLPTLRLAQYLYNWLLDHIMIHDKQIGLYIRENNIEIS